LRNPELAEGGKNLGSRGLARPGIVIVATMLALVGGTVVAPVLASAANVDPDSPFYGLKRLGEQIRGVSKEEQLKLRWQEFNSMAAKSKGVHFKWILEEFGQKMRDVIESAPNNVEAKQELIRWMQQQMPGVGEIRLRLMGWAHERLKGELENLPEAAPMVKSIGDEIEEIQKSLPGATEDEMEQIMARLQKVDERIKALMLKYGGRTRGWVKDYLEVDNLVEYIGVKIRANVAMGPKFKGGSK